MRLFILLHWNSSGLKCPAPTLCAWKRCSVDTHISIPECCQIKVNNRGHGGLPPVPEQLVKLSRVEKHLCVCVIFLTTMWCRDMVHRCVCVCGCQPHCYISLEIVAEYEALLMILFKVSEDAEENPDLQTNQWAFCHPVLNPDVWSMQGGTE